VPAGLIIGTALVAQAITGLTAQRDHYRAEAAKPRPTVTRTAPAPATESPHRTPPGSTTPRQQPAVTVIAASQPRGNTSGGGGMSSQARPGTGAPSGPRPAPPAATNRCSGTVLAVQALKTACVTVGGTR
jgi:hypothetical protein